MSGTIRAQLVVLGASGALGRGIVHAAASAGVPVVAVDRDARVLQSLRAELPEAQITLVTGTVDSDAEGAALAAELRAIEGPLMGIAMSDCAVIEGGRVLELSNEQLRQALDRGLMPHLTAARHLLPLLAADDRGGSLILISGPGGDQPWAGYGHRSVVAAALRMLAAVLHDEARSLHVRVQLLSIGKPLRSESNRRHACPQWPTAEDVGHRVLELLQHGDSSEPAVAVIDYSAATTSPGRLTHGSARAQAAGPTSTSEFPDQVFAGALPASCLQDARSLLRAILPSKRFKEF